MTGFGRAAAAALVLLVGAAACGDDDDDAGPAATTTTSTTTEAPADEGPAIEGSLTVFAAASLTDAFGEIGEAFEDANPEVTVTFNFAGSSALREQILSGAPADVFASANTSNMKQVVDGGAATDPSDFVENQLQIVVPAGNPAGVTGLADFADGDLLIGLCAEEVPCGQFGREALGKAGVTPAVDTNEPDVRSLLTKVENDDLDAGIVYRTDVMTAGDAVEGIDIPAEHNVLAVYPIVALTDAPNPDAAAAFVEFVLSEAGREILSSHGFDLP
ncbi:MAG: molybdate ABC transporter substrate-binding protein [Acidimicrobiia bacterium]